MTERHGFGREAGSGGGGAKAPALTPGEAADWRLVDEHLARLGNPVELVAALRRLRDPEARAAADKEVEDEAKAVAAAKAKADKDKAAKEKAAD